MSKANLIKQIHRSRLATKEELNQIHEIQICLSKLNIANSKYEEYTNALMKYIQGAEGSYYIDYPDCHPSILLSGVYDYLKQKTK